MEISNSDHIKELLDRISKGDEIAFTQLFNIWSHRLAGYLFRITESRQLSEEILQDVFMKIWTNREILGEIENFKAFLFVVTRNAAYMSLRSMMREEKHFKKWKKDTINPKVEERSEFDYYSILDQAIDTLAPRRKQVYLLSRHGKKTYQQIADELGISYESVKTHIKLSTMAIVKFIKSHHSDLALLVAFRLEIFFIAVPLIYLPLASLSY